LVEVEGSIVADIQETYWKPRFNPWLIALTVTLATFMEILDTAIANVSLPHIAGSLFRQPGRVYLGPDQLSGIERHHSADQCVLSTIIGRKRFYMTCVALFTCQQFPVRPGAQPGDADFLPSPAGDRWRRVAAQRTGDPGRYLSGFQARHGIRCLRNGRRCGARHWPTLGGWITDNFTWRWIFYINVPIGLISYF